jgi:predicted enzyme related to lactoylglutathione lyase
VVAQNSAGVEEEDLRSSPCVQEIRDATLGVLDDVESVSVLARVNVVVDVDDLQKYLDKAVSMGAEVVTPITEIPDMVTWAEFRDPAGNVIGISLADS